MVSNEEERFPDTRVAAHNNNNMEEQHGMIQRSPWRLRRRIFFMYGSAFALCLTTMVNQRLVTQLYQIQIQQQQIQQQQQQQQHLLNSNDLVSSHTTTDNGHNNPIQVYILAGQSNMAGMGSITHLDKLLGCNCSSTGTQYRDTLWNGTGYKELDNVYILYGKHHGKLTVSRTAGFAGGSGRFGTEVLFGWTMMDRHQQQQRKTSTNSTPPIILLIKVAYSGRDLAVDFRPPSAGMGDYGVDPDHYGWQYRVMINDTKQALNTIDQYIPNYNNSNGYALKGFVWFQGWNDLSTWRRVNEYESNLGHLIRDIRNDLNQSDLPFVIGELGMHGPNPTGKAANRVFTLRAAQKNVCASGEFQNDTIFVPTAQYAVLNGTKFNTFYHYYGRADTYYHIGQAFGNAMYQIMTQTTGDIR